MTMQGAQKKELKIKAGVIGHPAGHSLSPLIHNYWIRYYGFPGIYGIVDIMPDDFENGVRRLIEDGYIGFNVTIPYKQKIMALCDSVDETARRIGAVNTVIVDEAGRLRGINTDSYGFVENILTSDIPCDLKGAKALVLGAGGAARGIVHGLSRMGVEEITITNRTRQKAEEIATTFPVKIIDWTDRAAGLADIGILVNTTALGMEGQPALEIELDNLPPQALVCDIVYRPLQTHLIRDARARHNPVITGIGMLLHQARPAFREWFGVMPEVDKEMEQAVLKGLE